MSSSTAIDVKEPPEPATVTITYASRQVQIDASLYEKIVTWNAKRLSGSGWHEEIMELLCRPSEIQVSKLPSKLRPI